ERERERDYFAELERKLAAREGEGAVIYPPREQRFSAFSYSAAQALKVVILGQDPYHGAHQANGLAFSVAQSAKIPPSLRNIYKELASDIQGFTPPDHGDLTHWAEQGVLLLNSVLSVEEGNAGSHAKFGWERFTDCVIAEVNRLNPHCVFILWGAYAKLKGQAIDSTKHLILEGVHPSPLSASRGFFGCCHFSQANRWLVEQGVQPIDWRLAPMGSLSLF
ncbi:MAG: uracil-DNA glycosylase, partial [Pseudomonadales bacterium]